MNLNQVDVSKLPADVRKQFKQLQVELLDLES